MNKILLRIATNFRLSNLLNNYLYNVDLIKKYVKEINILKENNISVQKATNSSIIQDIINRESQDFISANKQALNKISNLTLNTMTASSEWKNFIRDIKKICISPLVSHEIKNNMNFAVGDKANNLTFHSQEVLFRDAPVVIMREFKDDFSLYEDHVLIGNQYEHHDHLINRHPELSSKCKDKNGIETLACAFLYSYKDDDNNIHNVIYISEEEQCSYPGEWNEVINILKQKVNLPLFSIKYKKKIKTNTYRLARKSYDK